MLEQGPIFVAQQFFVRFPPEMRTPAPVPLLLVRGSMPAQRALA